MAAPGESFTCSLGTDEKILVSFLHKKETPITSTFALARSVESVTCTNTIKIKNTRAYPIPKLVIRETVPVGTDPFKVLLTEPSQLATANPDVEIPVPKVKDVTVRWSKERPTAREEGLIEYVLKDIGAAEERKLELSWKVEAPPGTKWEYVTNNAPLYSY